MLEGTVTSLEIFFLTLLIAIPCGLFIAAGRMSKLWIVRAPIQAYLLVMRGTPLMLQLFFFYFGPYYIFGITGMNRFLGCNPGLWRLNYTAYFAEIYRGGIESIPIWPI